MWRPLPMKLCISTIFFISFFCWSVVSIVKTLGRFSPRVFLQLCSEGFTSSAYATFRTEDDRWDQKSNRQDVIRFKVKSQISFDIEYLFSPNDLHQVFMSFLVGYLQIKRNGKICWRHNYRIAFDMAPRNISAFMKWVQMISALCILRN